MNKAIRLLLAFCMVLWSFAAQAQSGHVYATWDTLEWDTCASAWLIKRFIDPQAEFRFYPKGELIEEGIAFDTPDAQWQRTAKAATFENLLAHYKLSDPALARIGALIHEVEINYWNTRPDAESRIINENINTIVSTYKENRAKALAMAMDEIENLYQKLSQEN